MISRFVCDFTLKTFVFFLSLSIRNEKKVTAKKKTIWIYLRAWSQNGYFQS